MTFYNITNAERFFERILACEGNVYSDGNGGQPQDLKKAAEYLLSSGMAGYMDGIGRIDVRVERSGDAAGLIRYMSEMIREPRAASRIA